MLYRFLQGNGADIPQTGDCFPWKHQLSPPPDSRTPAGFRAIYLYSDPRNIVLSVFRRNIQHCHLERMGQVSRRFGIPVERPARNPDSWKLQDLLNLESDPFRIQEQFLNWTKAKRDYPIMIVQFDSLWSRLPELFSFTGLPTQKMNSFPERRKRHSRWQDLEAEGKKRLNGMYEDIVQQVGEYPDFTIRRTGAASK